MYCVKPFAYARIRDMRGYTVTPSAVDSRRSRELLYGDLTTSPTWSHSAPVAARWSVDRELLQRNRTRSPGPAASRSLVMWIMGRGWELATRPPSTESAGGGVEGFADTRERDRSPRNESTWTFSSAVAWDRRLLMYWSRISLRCSMCPSLRFPTSFFAGRRGRTAMSTTPPSDNVSCRDWWRPANSLYRRSTVQERLPCCTTSSYWV
mmetsp:Transcript_24601/g.72129  ORF Transcript_24601/g.72129 Transcript_24601/m.72129 type:complete len:208 (-) Transcript_24601:1380-2003(-)